MRRMRFLAQTKGGREKERERKRNKWEEEGKEKGKGKLEMKLWQKRKKSQAPQPGIEPRTPTNAADALPLRLGRLRFIPFLPKLHFQFPFPFLLSLLFLSLSFSLRPFFCAKISGWLSKIGKAVTCWAIDVLRRFSTLTLFAVQTSDAKISSRPTSTRHHSKVKNIPTFALVQKRRRSHQESIRSGTQAQSQVIHRFKFHAHHV